MTAAAADNRTIHQRLHAVMSGIGAIGKTRNVKADGGGPQYKFRGIDDFMNSLYPELCAHGVLVLPEVIDRHVDYHERTTAKGYVSSTTHVYLTVRFTFSGLGGDSVSCVTVGEGADTSDKASSKAMSSALKYALMQSLMVPTEDMADQDADRPEIGSAPGKRGTGTRRPAHADLAEPERVQALLDTLEGAPDDVRSAMVAFCKERGVKLRGAPVPLEDVISCELKLATLHTPEA